MFVVEIVATLTTVLFVRDLVTGGGTSRLRRSRSSSGCGSPCCSPTSPKRWRKAAARRRRRRCARRRPRPWPSCLPRSARRLTRWLPAPSAEAGRYRAGRSRRPDPQRRRRDRRRRLGQRSRRSPANPRRSSAKAAATAPRSPAAPRVISDWIKVRITAAQGSHLPRPHDRAGRRRRAAEDAQRDRAQHPAGRPDDHLRLRRRDDPELRHLCRRRDVRGDPGGAVRRADPDHDRRAAVGHRHRRHGPAGALQRAGDVGPRGGGGGRRRHAAAGQDRHHHARQPPGDRVLPAAGRRRARTWPTRRSSPRCPDETPEGRSIVVLAKEKYGIRGRDMAPLDAHFIPFSAQTRHQRHRFRGLLDPQGRGRRGAGLCCDGRHAAGRRRCRSRGGRRRDAAVRELHRERRRDRQGRRHAAGGRARTAGCWASSI